MFSSLQPKRTTLKLNADSTTTTSSTTKTVEEEDNSPNSFVTTPVPVYIEDTDAYGVIYNANYIRAYDRALHRTSILSSSSSSSSSLSSVIQQHDGWSIVQIDNMKFKSSPPLGGLYVIRGVLMYTTETSEVWNMEMTSMDGDVVFNTAHGVHIAHPPITSSIFLQQPLNGEEEEEKKDMSWLPKPPPFHPLEEEKSSSSSSSSSLSYMYAFPTFRDEFDTHLSSHLPLHSLLKLFERCRSNMLGGPDELQKLLSGSDNEENNNSNNNDGILFVVTSVQDCALVCYEDVLKSNILIPGISVFVKTQLEVKRKGMILDFYHTALLKREGIKEEKKEDIVIGQGKVSIMSIGAKTRRPTSKLPRDLLKKLGIDV